MPWIHGRKFPDLKMASEIRQDLPATAVISLGGPLDATTAPALEEGLQPLIKAGILRYLFDLKEVLYLNSICDGLLINLAGLVKPKGGFVALFNVHPKIVTLCDMLGWREYWEIFNSLEEAIALVRKTASQTSKSKSPEGRS